MQITRAGEYGVLGLMALARRPFGQVVMIDEVSKEEDIPKSFLAKIFQSLSHAGMVHSIRGTGGGFALAKAPAEVTVLQIIEAIEGPIALQRCLENKPECAQLAQGCVLCGLLSQAQDRLKETLAGTTLADLCQRHSRRSASGEKGIKLEAVDTH